MKEYCTECGSATSYDSEKPKFCASCATPFDKEAPAKASHKKFKPAPKQTFSKHQIDEDEEEDEIDEQDDSEYGTTDLKGKLEFDVIIAGPRKEKLGELAVQPKNNDPLPPRERTKFSKKKFLEEYSREAGGGSARRESQEIK